MAPPSEKSWIRHCNVCNVPAVVLPLQNDNSDDNCYGDPYAKSNYCHQNHQKGILNNEVQGSYKISDLKMESDSDICGQLRIENFLGEEVSYPEGYAVADLIKFWTNYRYPRSNFLNFFSVFAEMWYNNRLAPSLWGWCLHLWEILDPPLIPVYALTHSDFQNLAS